MPIKGIPRAPSDRSRRRYWSGEVTGRSFALDLEADVFTLDDPRAIALSLKQSAEASTRRKGTPYQSAMSMLSFYINRAGTNLSPRRRRVLERAKRDLREVFGRA
jgi:hypothetical protein